MQRQYSITFRLVDSFSDHRLLESHAYIVMHMQVKGDALVSGLAACQDESGPGSLGTR